MTTTTYRVIFLALGLALIGVIVFAVILSPEGDPAGLPPQIERIAPADGDTVQRQTSLVVDMESGYSIVLTVDGVQIPESEIQVTEATGRYQWTPGPTSPFSEWSPGVHAVFIEWERRTGVTDPGSYRWTFRAL